MYYVFPPSNDDESFGSEITALVAPLPPDTKGNRAYVEINGPLRGVAIRGLTHFDDAIRERLLCDAEAIYRRMMTDNAPRVTAVPNKRRRCLSARVILPFRRP